jgi:hypothetical protein
VTGRRATRHAHATLPLSGNWPGDIYGTKKIYCSSARWNFPSHRCDEDSIAAIGAAFFVTEVARPAR